ncbi:hypothetical protein H6P81_015496 [Aristolochia fimbriata]|uniref:Uncharacterized protein n=1 Tax=Aristolochia fimbriata TaxID=158543 RepID=A0AAV7E703_ARIFI|nr:hypothetical protein H6P81_015496 [Aristolochia fimbriata]
MWMLLAREIPKKETLKVLWHDSFTHEGEAALALPVPDKLRGHSKLGLLFQKLNFTNGRRRKKTNKKSKPYLPTSHGTVERHLGWPPFPLSFSLESSACSAAC